MAHTRAGIENYANAVRSILADSDKLFANAPYLKMGDKARRAVELLGGKLKVVNNQKDWKSEWGDGRILPRASGTKFQIEIPGFNPPHRNVFTLAHELGHLFLHFHFGTSNWGLFEDFNDTFLARSGTGVLESEAHHFAGCLLMPSDEIEAMLNVNESTLSIARHFGVSADAAHVRQRYL